MPAAAVIPALMVYANIVAVKKLVVGYFRELILCDLNDLPKKSIIPIFHNFGVGLYFSITELVYFYFEENCVF